MHGKSAGLRLEVALLGTGLPLLLGRVRYRENVMLILDQLGVSGRIFCARAFAPNLDIQICSKGGHFNNPNIWLRTKFRSLD